ncbi:MAG: DUF294 nucleotidyltransferase-like domain-containing protein [Wenzhouxiangellaceae bacterium]|nr:DUF294 nucleotidyltransferase-like domain-containing protein [Wenzhouxiangellaceae bacterium]
MNRVPTDLTDFLHTVTPFSELSEAAVERIAGQLQIRYSSEGESLGRFEPPGQDGLFIIRKGAVELLDSDQQRLERRSEGELFGHRINFDPAVEGYQVRAIEDCLIWSLSADRLETILKHHPAVAEFLSASHGGRLRSEAFARRSLETLGELPLRRPVTAGPDDSIVECARAMAREQVSCMPIVSDQGLVGIITDRDLRARVIAAGLDPNSDVSRIMTGEPATVTTRARIDHALVEMMRLGIHHLPVINEAGKLAGVVSSGDLMRSQSPHPLRLVRDIQRASGPGQVAELARKGPALLAGLVRADGDVSQIGRIAGRITDACTRRLLALAEDQWGPPPRPYAWLAFGSQARLEQGLISDQDNGLLLADAPEDQHRQHSTYFERLANYVCDGLNDCGYIFCPGGVMAKGEWRMSYTDWRRRFEGWIREPEPKSVMQSSIFFDLRAVAGDREMARRLHADVLQKARDSEIFRRFLAAESMTHKPPLGLFRQFVQERGGEQSHGLNLKKRGVIPIVDLARVRALEGAVGVVHTEERLQATAQARLITERDADDLIHALRFIGNIRLKHQARQLEAGETPDHLVDPSELSGLHRRYLRSAFGIVDSAQKALAQRYLL